MLRGPGLRAIVGVCALPGGKRSGRGKAGIARGEVLCRCMCPLAAARLCGLLEEKLAIFCDRGKDFADECKYLVHLLVSGGRRVC